MTKPFPDPISFMRSVAAPVWVIFGLCVLLELTLQGSDAGMWGARSWRNTAYGWGGFWPGLLQDWRPNYTLQPYAMFLSYGFLHGGASHLVVNMITLFSLSPILIERVGGLRFSLLYALSIFGGALGFALLSSGLTPMVGASGALFGLVGAWLAWEYVDRFTGRAALWPVMQAVLLLIGLNLILWWAMEGQLAWETHLGGFVTGWVAAMLLDPTARRL